MSKIIFWVFFLNLTMPQLICSLRESIAEEDNADLNAFIVDYNMKFGIPPKKWAHQLLGKGGPIAPATNCHCFCYGPIPSSPDYIQISMKEP